MPPNPNHFAVCVGIDHYPEFRPLKGAANDAVRFSEWLLNEDEGGLPYDQVETILLDPAADRTKIRRSDAKPSRDQVFDRLADFQNRFKKRLDEDPFAWDTSRLYIYLSGHGLASDIHDTALLLANASPDMLGENISCARLISYFGNSQYFKEVVVFADCCREQSDDFEVASIPLTRKKNKFGRMSTLVGFATGFGDLAFEAHAIPHPNVDFGEARGYFTQALIECLRAGSADPNDPDGVDSIDLAKWVPKRVEELTKNRPKPQIPSIFPDAGSPIKFTRPPDQGALSKVVIELNKPALQAMVVLNAKTEEVGRIPIGDHVLKLALPRQEYRVRPEDGSSQENGYFEVKGGDLHVRL